MLFCDLGFFVVLIISLIHHERRNGLVAESVTFILIGSIRGGSSNQVKIWEVRVVDDLSQLLEAQVAEESIIEFADDSQRHEVHHHSEEVVALQNDKEVDRLNDEDAESLHKASQPRENRTLEPVVVVKRKLHVVHATAQLVEELHVQNHAAQKPGNHDPGRRWELSKLSLTVLVFIGPDLVR